MTPDDVARDDGRPLEVGRVTLGTIQLQLLRVEGSIGALRTDIQYIRESQLTKSTETERRFTDQENRLRILEAKRYVETSSMWKLATAFLGASSIIVAIIAAILK